MYVLLSCLYAYLILTVQVPLYSLGFCPLRDGYPIGIGLHPHGFHGSYQKWA